MSEFMFLYRLPAESPFHPDSPQQLQERMEKWRGWFKSLQDQGRLKEYGHPLASDGSVVRGKRVTDGPYAESKDIVIGFSVVEAADLAAASALAADCPVAEYGGLVEVRPLRQA